MTENKRFRIDDDGIVTDMVDLSMYIDNEDCCEKLNELAEENQFLKEKEKDMLDYLKQEYDYVYKQKIKHLDDAILARSYELIEYHIRSMIEHLERL